VDAIHITIKGCTKTRLNCDSYIEDIKATLLQNSAVRMWLVRLLEASHSRLHANDHNVSVFGVARRPASSE